MERQHIDDERRGKMTEVLNYMLEVTGYKDVESVPCVDREINLNKTYVDKVMHFASFTNMTASYQSNEVLMLHNLCQLDSHGLKAMNAHCESDIMRT